MFEIYFYSFIWQWGFNYTFSFTSKQRSSSRSYGCVAPDNPEGRREKIGYEIRSSLVPHGIKSSLLKLNKMEIRPWSWLRSQRFMLGKDQIRLLSNYLHMSTLRLWTPISRYNINSRINNNFLIIFKFLRENM